jgi:hypothetical protein
MLSHTGTSFADDMGYKRDGGWYPGVTVFKRLDGQILRIFDPELQSRRRLLQRLAPVRPDAPGRGGPVGEVQIRGGGMTVTTERASQRNVRKFWRRRTAERRPA